ncbi:unnamed protein product [Brassica napus]|uniref:(rape) hypothetical protein n=1 Tax=Brassica napus TaxID=3708 RepID=A0A816IG03_BRANA|nr:unnamed protein product [Brassica napus]
MNAIIKTEVAVNKVGIIKTPNHPMTTGVSNLIRSPSFRLSVSVSAQQKIDGECLIELIRSCRNKVQVYRFSLSKVKSHKRRKVHRRLGTTPTETRPGLPRGQQWGILDNGRKPDPAILLVMHYDRRNRAKPETDQFKELIPNGEKEYLLLCDSNRAASRSHIPPGGRLGRGHKGLYDTINNSIHFQLGATLAAFPVTRDSRLFYFLMLAMYSGQIGSLKASK